MVSGGSVLFYMPVIPRSMRITFMPVAAEMAIRGHEVVVVSQYPDTNPNPNITEIIVDEKRQLATFYNKISQQTLNEGVETYASIMEFCDVAISVSDQSCRSR